MAESETSSCFNLGYQDIIYIHSSSGSKFLQLLCGITTLIKTLRINNYTIIVSSLWPVIPAVIFCRFIFLRHKFKWIHFIHSETFFSKLDLIFTFLAIKFADGILCDSSPAADLVRGFNRNKSLDIVRPFMKISCLPIRKTESQAKYFNFITWGRITHGKNLDYAIRLINELCKMNCQAHLTIVGPDEDGLMPWLNQISIELGVFERIKFVGKMTREEIFKSSINYNCFIVASSHEGMCISLTEAMQLGLLPVVSMVGGINEYCVDGDNCVQLDLFNVSKTADRLVGLSELDRINIIEAAKLTFKNSNDYAPSYFMAVKKLVS